MPAATRFGLDTHGWEICPEDIRIVLRDLGLCVAAAA